MKREFNKLIDDLFEECHFDGHSVSLEYFQKSVLAQVAGAGGVVVVADHGSGVWWSVVECGGVW